jgi:solute carrier family 10 (sodium/bile acid cotransporter), member 7
MSVSACSFLCLCAPHGFHLVAWCWFYRGVVQVRNLVDSHKKSVRNISTACLASVPFSQIGVAKSSGYLDGLSAFCLASLVALIWGTLISLRAVNLLLAATMKVSKGVQRAVVLAGSQKTLPISVAVIAQLSSVLGSSAGLAVLPCVFAHFSQVLIDSMLVSWWLRSDG